MTVRIAALLTFALLVGCAGDNTQSLLILQNDVPTTDQGVCVAPAGGSVFRASGKLDVYFFTDYDGDPGPYAGYLLFLAVRNNLETQAIGQETTIPESALNIEITRADVSLVDAASGAAIGQAFSVPVYKMAEPGDTVGLIIEAVPYQTAAALPQDGLIFARVTVVGNRSGDEIRSNQMEYPIETCYGCLFRDAGSCVGLVTEGAANACNIAQDEIAVCCHHSTFGLVCPAVSESETPTE